MSPLQTLRSLFHELFSWEDEELMPIDFVMASYLSAFLPGAVEKAWGDLCGPASIGKSEILDALEDGEQRTIYADNLTENAFVSAFRDEENPEDDKSLAWRLCRSREPKGPKVLILRELSTFLTMRPDKVSKFFANLRQAYGGSFTNATGNLGLDTKNDLQFGLLTACTEKLDEFRATNQTLGERTMVCRIGRHQSSYERHRQIAEFAIFGGNIEKAALRANIKATTRRAIDDAIAHIQQTGGEVKRPLDLLSKVGRLAAVATRVRTVPTSAKSYATVGEAAPRLARQLKTWVDCRVLFDGRVAWTEGDYQMARRIAQDTMPPCNLSAIAVLWQGSVESSGTPVTAEHIRRNALAGEGFWRQLRQWAIVDILREHSNGVYSLNPAFALDVEYTDFLKGVTYVRSA